MGKEPPLKEDTTWILMPFTSDKTTLKKRWPNLSKETSASTVKYQDATPKTAARRLWTVPNKAVEVLRLKLKQPKDSLLKNS